MRAGGEIKVNNDIANDALFGSGWRNASGAAPSLTGATPSSNAILPAPTSTPTAPTSTPTSANGASQQGLMKAMKTQAIGQAVAMGIQTVGNMTTSIISHCTKMSALRSQERMQNRSYKAQKEAIKDESALVDDIKAINSNKIAKAEPYVESQKDLKIAEARLLEAKKTQKAMKKANKALVKKALSNRRGRFYGKTA